MITGAMHSAWLSLGTSTTESSGGKTGCEFWAGGGRPVPPAERMSVLIGVVVGHGRHIRATAKATNATDFERFKRLNEEKKVRERVDAAEVSTHGGNADRNPCTCAHTDRQSRVNFYPNRRVHFVITGVRCMRRRSESRKRRRRKRSARHGSLRNGDRKPNGWFRDPAGANCVGGVLLVVARRCGFDVLWAGLNPVCPSCRCSQREEQTREAQLLAKKKEEDELAERLRLREQAKKEREALTGTLDIHEQSNAMMDFTNEDNDDDDLDDMLDE